MNENPDIPAVIYRYCGVHAFHAMLRNKQLWLTDVHFMNDSTEQTHFIAKAKEVLSEVLQEPGKAFIQLLIHNFDWMSLTAYACCFSKEGDLLSQWRAYGDDGAGFAVGFSADWLRKQRRKCVPKHPLELLEVEYDDTRQLELATTCIREYLQQVPGLSCNERREVAMFAITRMWVLSAACKNESFHEEKEVRLILVEVSDPESATDADRQAVGISSICHRLSGMQRIPYFTLEFSPAAIAEIRLGPKNCATEDRSDLEMFLRSNGYDCDQIRIAPSQVPYR